MFYLDDNQYKIRQRFNYFSNTLILVFYLSSYYFLDRTYEGVWLGFPVTIVSYSILRCLVLQRGLNSGPEFYNARSIIIKLTIWMFVTNAWFFTIQYVALYPIAMQTFLPANSVLSSATEYVGPSTGIQDKYWSLSFSIDSEYLTQDPRVSEDMIGLPNYTGCGCGVEYGPWGDIIFNPAPPFKYHHNKFGVPGVKLPTWLCVCFQRESVAILLILHQIKAGVTFIQLHYRIVGDPSLALDNTGVSSSRHELSSQVYREPIGVPSPDSVFFNFLITFPLSTSSLAILCWQLSVIHLN